MTQLDRIEWMLKRVLLNQGHDPEGIAAWLRYCDAEAEIERQSDEYRESVERLKNAELRRAAR